jgi:hypothetical protein
MYNNSNEIERKVEKKEKRIRNVERVRKTGTAAW